MLFDIKVGNLVKKPYKTKCFVGLVKLMLLSIVKSTV